LEVPALTPVTSPVDASIVALAVLLLLHTPPVGDDVSVLPLPAHADNEPPIVDGAAVTVTSVFAAQPVDNV
jgi:hypothetical protein